jgi:hypothetical protein
MTVIALRHTYTPTTPLLAWWVEWHKYSRTPLRKVIPGEQLSLHHPGSNMKIWAFEGDELLWDTFATWVNTTAHLHISTAPTLHLYLDTSTISVKKHPFRLVLEPLPMNREHAIKYANHYWQTDLQQLFLETVDIDRTESEPHTLMSLSV